MKGLFAKVACCACAAIASVSHAGVVLEPSAAPEWKVSEWINGDPGKLADQRGKIVLINFFQLWCPGSNEFSIPLFERWEKEFGDREDVVLVSIHTVFENHDAQAPEQLRAFVAERGITHPVGIDAYPGSGGPVPVTMDRFETGGTPHVAIVDSYGDLVFTHFGLFAPDPVERFITRMLSKDTKKSGGSITWDERKKERRQSASERAGRNRGSKRSERSGPSRRKKDRSERAEEPVEEEPEAIDEEDAPGPDELQKESPDQESEDEVDPSDVSLSGSYKLRFEQLSKSCGELDAPMEVITQLSVESDRIVAKFSRPYLGIRELSVPYSSGSSDFAGDLEQEARERGGVSVQLNLQLSGRFVNLNDPPELEYDYYLEKTSDDGELDCVIEGTGGGSRFRGR